MIEEVERVPITALARLGRRISVLLDRARSRRCDFLVLEREYRNRPGTYEQIFWQTQQSMRQRRPSITLPGPPPGSTRCASPAFCGVIAELYAAHPALRIVFCANRKSANEWTRRYFDAVWADERGESIPGTDEESP